MNAIHPLYSLRNVRRKFGDREVLNIESLDLEAGKIYGLFGPNGAGKTTLMRILAFMDCPNEGSIKFNQNEISLDFFARYRARVVWVPQSPVLFTGTVLYNIEYPMRLKGVRRNVSREKAFELLDCVGLRQLAASPAHRLSGGETQRASIARALAVMPEVILLDEPTANVDYYSRGEIINLLQTLWRERSLSIIVTSHDNALLEDLCQVKITLHNGKITSQHVQGGKTKEEMSDLLFFAQLRLEDDGCLVMTIGRVASRHSWGHSEASEGWVENAKATILGLAEKMDGVHVYISSPSVGKLTVLLDQPDDINLARQLTLEKTIQVRMKKNYLTQN